MGNWSLDNAPVYVMMDLMNRLASPYDINPLRLNPLRDLVARLVAAVMDQDADMACANSGGRNHPVFALWPVRLADDLRKAVVNEELRKVDVWTGRYKIARVEFDAGQGDPFFNVNRPEDLEAAAALLGNA